MKLSSKQVFTMLEKAVEKANEINVSVNIAILDTGGHLLGFIRMNNAYKACIDIAIGKAKTSMLYGISSEEVAEFLKPESKMYGVLNTNGGLLGFKGGIPVTLENEIVAYIGVSGGSPEEDLEVAIAGSNF